LPGPSGCFQQAPGTYFHQPEILSSGTARSGGLNTTDPGTSFSSGTSGKSLALGFCSATVMYFAASTNLANCSLVTSVLSIQKPSSSTVWIGRASPNGV